MVRQAHHEARILPSYQPRILSRQQSLILRLSHPLILSLSKDEAAGPVDLGRVP